MRGQDPNHLTPRDITILQELLDPKGLTHKQIANNLGVSTELIKVQITRIGRKFGWSYCNTPRLIIWAFMNADEVGLVLPTKDTKI